MDGGQGGWCVGGVISTFTCFNTSLISPSLLLFLTLGHLHLHLSQLCPPFDPLPQLNFTACTAPHGSIHVSILIDNIYHYFVYCLILKFTSPRPCPHVMSSCAPLLLSSAARSSVKPNWQLPNTATPARPQQQQQQQQPQSVPAGILINRQQQ
jgi:hypothetical protein